MTDAPLWVPLEGAVNVRDLGGLPTDDGGRTAPGRLLRSDNLQGLTSADVRRLVDDLGVRTVVDLRTTVEVDKEGPGPLTTESRVAHRHLSLYPESGRLTDVEADTVLPWQTDWGRAGAADPDADNPTVGYYLAYLKHRPDSVLEAVRTMAAPDRGAVLVHCAAGKDRTGVVVALALSAVGVSREAVVADYVATGDRLEAVLDRLMSSPTYAADLDGTPADVHRPRPQTMQRFLELLDERFGGPVGWLAAVGFGAEELTALRHRLLT
ncbi:MAG TPA: tyrosine-protein phosphatase [Mycobacteriales bacterium]|jgi:protein tyrosine/serine phosphatase|nr:tyrosine-protein phosphatase [Mycobacteriales bacterium]